MWAAILGRSKIDASKIDLLIPTILKAPPWAAQKLVFHPHRVRRFLFCRVCPARDTRQ